MTARDVVLDRAGTPLQIISELVRDGGWPGAPRFVPSDDEALASVLTVRGLLHTLAHYQPRESQFSMMKHGRTVDPCLYRSQDGGLDRGRALHLLRRGASLHLYQADEWIPSLGAVCTELAEYLQHEVWPVLIITPPHEQGFGLHTDEFDVFVVQLHGTKRWQVHAQQEGRVAKRLNIPDDEAGDLAFAGDLAKGDLLYLPTGCAHQAHSLETISAHVSFIIKPPALRDVLLAQCRDILAAAEFDTPVQPRPMSGVDLVRDDVTKAVADARASLVSSLTAQRDVTPLQAVRSFQPSTKPGSAHDWSDFFGDAG